MTSRGGACALDPEAEAIEVSLLFEGIYRRYGHDFREYEPRFVRKRIRARMKEERLAGVSALLERVLRDPACMDRLLRDLTIPPSPMFDPPAFYRTFRKRVVPRLRTYPSVRLWQIGSRTADEAYALAILLEEEGLAERARIYATTPGGAFEPQAGDFPLNRAAESARNHRRSGGKGCLEDYGEPAGERPVFRSPLRDRVALTPHCLVTDGAFNEFQVVLCRNVLPAFRDPLKLRLHGLVHRSLSRFGLLSVGPGESLGDSPHRECYEPVSAREGLFKKVKE